MKAFILDNWLSILIMAAFLIIAGALAVKGKWAVLRALGYELILQAEKTITGTKKGKERFDAVFQQIYSLIPFWLRFFFTEETIRKKLQEWFITIKDYMDNGKIDKSISQ